jgi:amino acid permease
MVAPRFLAMQLPPAEKGMSYLCRCCLLLLLWVSLGGWMLATAHIVTAIIGAGVLGLPFAMSWLGLVAGVIVLVLFFIITLWCSLLLSEMHEVNGVKHPTYRSAVRGVLGKQAWGKVAAA